MEIVAMRRVVLGGTGISFSRWIFKGFFGSSVAVESVVAPQNR
jgi:hypothetical protein